MKCSRSRLRGRHVAVLNSERCPENRRDTSLTATQVDPNIQSAHVRCTNQPTKLSSSMMKKHPLSDVFSSFTKVPIRELIASPNYSTKKTFRHPPRKNGLAKRSTEF